MVSIRMKLKRPGAWFCPWSLRVAVALPIQELVVAYFRWAFGHTAGLFVSRDFTFLGCLKLEWRLEVQLV